MSTHCCSQPHVAQVCKNEPLMRSSARLLVCLACLLQCALHKTVIEDTRRYTPATEQYGFKAGRLALSRARTVSSRCVLSVPPSVEHLLQRLKCEEMRSTCFSAPPYAARIKAFCNTPPARRELCDS
eukprot:5446377-Amphidinium_carterae.1